MMKPGLLTPFAIMVLIAAPALAATKPALAASVPAKPAHTVHVKTTTTKTVKKAH